MPCICLRCNELMPGVTMTTLHEDEGQSPVPAYLIGFIVSGLTWLFCSYTLFFFCHTRQDLESIRLPSKTRRTRHASLADWPSL